MTNYTREEFVAQLLESITVVLREKVASGKIVIATNTGIDGLARELANNAAAAPWIDIEIEREATEATLRNAEEFARDAIAEAKAIDAVLERHEVPLYVDGDNEPLELATRVGMLGARVLHMGPPAPPVARGPISLSKCACATPVFTCVTCNALAPIGELKIALLRLADATKEMLEADQPVSWDANNVRAALAAAEGVLGGDTNT